LTLGSGGDVTSLLDAILTTRYPDPIERARVVQDVIRRQGLPANLSRPLTLYTQQAYISTARSLTVGLLGTNNALSMSVGYLRLEGVTPNSVLLAPIGVATSAQRALAITYSRRMSPLLAFNATVGRTRVDELGTALPLSTTQRTLRVSLTRQLSPKAELIIGGRRQVAKSNAALDSVESAAFVGISKRF
jgi:uncharacterized protein (PEP-CTERM system associated)